VLGAPTRRPTHLRLEEARQFIEHVVASRLLAGTLREVALDEAADSLGNHLAEVTALGVHAALLDELGQAIGSLAGHVEGDREVAS